MTTTPPRRTPSASWYLTAAWAAFRRLRRTTPCRDGRATDYRLPRLRAHLFAPLDKAHARIERSRARGVQDQ